MGISPTLPVPAAGRQFLLLPVQIAFRQPANPPMVHSSNLLEEHAGTINSVELAEQPDRDVLAKKEIDTSTLKTIGISSLAYRVASPFVLAVLLGGLYLAKDYWVPQLEAFVRPNANVEKPKPRPPLVTVAQAIRQTVPQYIQCLGTVTAFNSVVIKSRVEGELIEIAFQEGQTVEAGQLLATLDQRPFTTARDQASGQLQRDEAALELARLNFERSQSAPVRDALSRQELDELKAAYRSAQAAVEVSRNQLAQAQLQLDYTKIVAPIRGTVGLRQVDVGNMIKASDNSGLLVITQLDPISVVFSIPQDDIPRVRKRLLEAQATEVLAFDRNFRTLLATGELAALDNQVDSTTGTLRLKANFGNKDSLLFPNQFVNVRLLVKSWDDAIVVPSASILRGPDFQYVYVVGEDATVDAQKVTVAFSEGGISIIESGLDAGQTVVTEGTDRLQPKGKVTLSEQERPAVGKPGADEIRGVEQLSAVRANQSGDAAGSKDSSAESKSEDKQ